jgi:hypothetical protein
VERSNVVDEHGISKKLKQKILGHKLLRKDLKVDVFAAEDLFLQVVQR